MGWDESNGDGGFYNFCMLLAATKLITFVVYTMQRNPCTYMYAK